MDTTKKIIHPCEAATTEQLDKMFRVIVFRGDKTDLKRFVREAAPGAVRWEQVRHLRITGNSRVARTLGSTDDDSSQHFYASADGSWLLIVTDMPLPEDYLKYCGGILESLWIRNERISMLPGLSNLPQLLSLDLSGCSNLTELPELGSLTRLTQLILYECRSLTKLTGVEKLTQLTSLDLSGCESLTHLPGFRPLVQLTNLNLSWCKALASLDLAGCRSLSKLLGLDTLTQLIELNLSGCSSLAALPTLGNLKQLFSLNISHCISLTSLNLAGCTSLSELLGLRRLTQLTDLNLSLCRSLTTLNLSGCSSLSKLLGLDTMNQLIELNLSGCSSLTHLPGLGSLTHLTSLNLSGCNFITQLNLSGCISLTRLTGLDELTQLTYLNLSRCRSLNLLPGLGSLKQLTSLDLSMCSSLTELPAELRDLKSLRRLNLWDMMLSTLPDWLPDIAEGFSLYRVMGAGEHKAIVYLDGTTVEDMPDMSIFSQPYEVVAEWFEKRKLGQTHPLNEIKVVFLGDGEAGKSHTIARLMNGGGTPDYAVFDGQSTPGIVIRNKEYDLDGRKITVHYWDFGGQEIMHSMHRIFLTGRTMYVILLNARDDTQSDRAKYWLHNVKSFAPDAPVLLVLNKIDQNPNASVDEKDLRARYDKLTRVVRLSALDFTKEEFNSAFTAVLLEEIQETGFLDAQWPATWTQVKKKLENMQTHYIMGDAYEDICEECNVDKNQEELLHWFNDLGVSFCCCDEKDYKLKDYVILRPDWITNALYILLFNPLTGARNGRIPHKSIYDILRSAHKNPEIRRTLPKAKYTGNDIQYVLGVMHKFNLSLAHGDDDEFIPMLCQRDSTVDVQKLQADSSILEFNMDFDYLPPNLLHRLMVERHPELDMENVWRTGARFQLNELNLSAVVVIDGNTLRFFIRYIDPGKAESKPMHRPNTYLTMLKAHVDRIVEHMGLQPPTCRLIYKLDGKQDTFDYEDVKLHLELGETAIISKAHRKKLRITDILNQSAPDGLEDEMKLLDAIQRSCRNIQGEPDYCLNGDGQGLEDKRNRRIRDDLFGWGYKIQDQSQRGRSGSGKSIGELDLLLHNEKRELWTAIEALRVSDGVTAQWKKHLDKLISSYNFFGARFLYLLTYVDADPKAFDRIWKGYQTKIPQYDPGQYKYSPKSLDVTVADSYGYIKTAKCRYTSGDTSVTIYHVFARIPTKDE